MESSKQDIPTLLTLIKRFLPQFEVTKGDLLKPNPTFVINFYTHFLRELMNNCGLLLNCTFEDVLSSCPHDVDKEMFLFLYIRDILKKIGIPYFTICDFYRPSDRTRTTMKVCLHFLFYIKDAFPNCQGIIQCFNVNIEKRKTEYERIVSKKNELSKIAYNTGLLKEKLDVLTKEYAETTPSDIDNIQLDSDIEKLKKELVTLEANLAKKRQSLDSVNEEIEMLQNQIITENYESYNNELYQLQVDVKKNDDLISKNQKVLEEEEKILRSYNECAASIQKFDLLPLNNVEEVFELEQKIRDMESDKRRVISTISGKNKMIETKCKKMAEANKNFQREIIQIRKTLSEKNGAITVLDAKVHTEVLLHERLAADYEEIKQQLDCSERKCNVLQVEQLHLENKCKEYYKRMFNCQNTLIETFTNVSANISAIYQE